MEDKVSQSPNYMDVVYSFNILIQLLQITLMSDAVVLSEHFKITLTESVYSLKLLSPECL